MVMGEKSFVALLVLGLFEATISHTFVSRRMVFGGSASALILGTGSDKARAASQRNALMSKPLEFIRIAQQEAADNIQYGGELAPVDMGGSGPSPASLLVPIVRISTILTQVRDSIDKPENWNELRSTLSAPPLSKKEFKQVFNAFADNIYYSTDSERANAYLGGGAAPTTQQTTQYLLRNEILANVEISVLELDYLIKLRDKGETPKDVLVGEELGDLRGFLDKAIETLDQYLAIARNDGSEKEANSLRVKRERQEWFQETP